MRFKRPMPAEHYAPLARFKSFYDDFKVADLGMLGEFYAEDLVFRDPGQEVRGLPALRCYLPRPRPTLLNAGLSFSMSRFARICGFSVGACTTDTRGSQAENPCSWRG